MGYAQAELWHTASLSSTTAAKRAELQRRIAALQHHAGGGALRGSVQQGEAVGRRGELLDGTLALLQSARAAGEARRWALLAGWWAAGKQKRSSGRSNCGASS